MNLAKMLQTHRTIRVAGVDDAHYADKSRGSKVYFSAIVCGGTRFEGMLWGDLEKDGTDATYKIASLLGESKFFPQLHLVLLDGITFGGCNVVDLSQLHDRLNLPIVAVMRRPPNMERFEHVVNKFDDAEERWRCTQAAGEVHQLDGWTFQCVGEEPEIIAKSLQRLTDNGKVPEALRLAHLIGSAVMLGESSNRA